MSISTNLDWFDLISLRSLLLYSHLASKATPAINPNSQTTTLPLYQKLKISNCGSLDLPLIILKDRANKGLQHHLPGPWWCNWCLITKFQPSTRPFSRQRVLSAVNAPFCRQHFPSAVIQFSSSVSSLRPRTADRDGNINPTSPLQHAVFPGPSPQPSGTLATPSSSNLFAPFYSALRYVVFRKRSADFKPTPEFSNLNGCFKHHRYLSPFHLPLRWLRDQMATGSDGYGIRWLRDQMSTGSDGYGIRWLRDQLDSGFFQFLALILSSSGMRRCGRGWKENFVIECPKFSTTVRQRENSATYLRNQLHARRSATIARL